MNSTRVRGRNELIVFSSVWLSSINKSRRNKECLWNTLLLNAPSGACIARQGQYYLSRLTWPANLSKPSSYVHDPNKITIFTTCSRAITSATLYLMPHAPPALIYRVLQQWECWLFRPVSPSYVRELINRHVWLSFFIVLPLLSLAAVSVCTDTRSIRGHFFRAMLWALRCLTGHLSQW